MSAAQPPCTLGRMVISAGMTIEEVASALDLLPGEIQYYGRDAAKIELSALDRLSGAPDGKLVSVTAMTPTRFGEGKTTTAISLVEALGRIDVRSLLCLREPSLGPVFGLKGGGTGGGQAQVVPMEQINLHFTGDIHAIGAANNLLAAAIDAHLLHGNELALDPHSISWRRCVDMDDRALRQIVVGLGGRPNGYPRETGFDITAASEVMAIVAVSRNLHDLRKRLGAITVGASFEGEPVTAEQLGVAGSMAVLLREAIKPNLARTLEGEPALIHCGPFANIAHGNNSVLADLLGLKLADYVVTESGFGADMGFEKFVDIICRSNGIAPSAVVLVATVQALKHHGGDSDGGVIALERGIANLAANLRIVHAFGLPCVIAINRFAGDSDAEIDAARSLAAALDVVGVAVNEGFERGGEGAVELAEAVIDATSGATSPPSFLYELDESIERKIHDVATRAYGAAGVELSPAASAQAARFEQAGLGKLPVCMAKTHLSLSHDATLIGAPTGFTLPVRELRPYTGAGWIVAVCGDMQTMPGLPAQSAAQRIDLDASGATVGLR
ncbi:MAG TPA: formate--tetrahydrofolate ligase [Gaiellaceae bacterium]|nr:formate--tetrahydrofolate ligase [Gaiellaceae bacterium]